VVPTRDDQQNRRRNVCEGRLVQAGVDHDCDDGADPDPESSSSKQRRSRALACGQQPERQLCGARITAQEAAHCEHAVSQRRIGWQLELFLLGGRQPVEDQRRESCFAERGHGGQVVGAPSRLWG
jgi:hypothetical protein